MQPAVSQVFSYPETHRLSCGEAVGLSDNPQFGLGEYALDERIARAQSAVDFASRVQRWVDGSSQAIRGRLEGRKEFVVGECVTDDQEIDIAGHDVFGLCNGPKDEREVYLPGQWRKRGSQDIDETGRLQNQTPQFLKNRC